MKDSEVKMGDQTILYKYICDKLSSGGLKREELEKIKGYPIGHNSVEGFVKLNVQLGNLDWRGDTLVNADRTLALKLTSTEEEKLEKLAEEKGVSTREFITHLIIEKLE